MNSSEDLDGEERSRFRRGARARLEALRQLRRELPENPGPSMVALARLATFLHEGAERLGFPAVAHAAGVLAGATAEELEEAADELGAVLQELAGTGQPTRVLVVEDDPTTVQLVRAVLEREGCRVEAVSMAGEARARIREEPPDLLLLDLVLPDLDGRLLLMELRSREELRHIPVVAVSGRTGGAVRAECFAYGADGFVAKPVDRQQLVETVSPLFGRSSPAAPEMRALAHVEERDQLGRRFRELQEARRRNPDSNRRLTAALMEVDTEPEDGGGQEDSEVEGRGTRERVAGLATALRSYMGGHDVVGRWSPAELLLLAPERRPEELAEGLELLRESVDDPVRRFSGGVVPVSADDELVDVVARAQRLLARQDGSPAIETVEEHPDPLPSRSVVIAEDDPVTATLIRHYMERAGMTVEVKENGKDAWEAVRSLRPALVVLDVQMPGMDGLEVLARLRREEATGDTRIIMLTSLGGDDNIARAFELGADDYVVKPFSPGEFMARALRLVRNG